jgi:hypothetical protein
MLFFVESHSWHTRTNQKPKVVQWRKTLIGRIFAGQSERNAPHPFASACRRITFSCFAYAANILNEFKGRQGPFSISGIVSQAIVNGRNNWKHSVLKGKNELFADTNSFGLPHRRQPFDTFEIGFASIRHLGNFCTATKIAEILKF